MKILLIIIVLVSCVCTNLVYGQDGSCYVLGGECIPINDCPVLIPYIKVSPKTRHMVKEYQCGYNGYTPKVCCPPEDCNLHQLMTKTCRANYDTEDSPKTIEDYPETTENYPETGVNIFWCYKLISGSISLYKDRKFNTIVNVSFVLYHLNVLLWSVGHSKDTYIFNSFRGLLVK